MTTENRVEKACYQAAQEAYRAHNDMQPLCDTLQEFFFAYIASDVLPLEATLRSDIVVSYRYLLNLLQDIDKAMKGGSHE